MYKNLIEMFRENEGKGAVGAFNLHCFEMLPAMIAAAQELGTPIRRLWGLRNISDLRH